MARNWEQLTAGLVTSTYVLFTTTSAMQNGYLVAVIEDCCADEPTIHRRILDWYQFIFERATSDSLESHYPEWSKAIKKLGEFKPKEFEKDISK